MTIERNLWRAKVLVGGVVVRGSRGTFLLPAAKGLPVRARLKHAGDPLPSLEVGGSVHRFGPHNPRAIWICAWLPMLWISVGWVGLVIAVLGWVANALVMNQTLWRPLTKAAVTLAVGLATIPAAGLLGLTVHDWYLDVSGQEPPSPRSVGFGACVNTSGGTSVEVELKDVTRCSGRHDGEVVFVTTHGSSLRTTPDCSGR